MTIIDTSDVTTLRRFNAETTLAVLRSAPRRWFTVRELAASTALSRPTVARVLDDLAESGWLTSVAGTPGETGRPARRFTFNRERGLVLSFDIAPLFLSIVVTDLAGETLASGTRLDFQLTEHHEMVSMLRELADQTLAQLPADLPVMAVCVAMPGTLNDAGVLNSSTFAREWIGMDLRRPLAAAFPNAAIRLGQASDLTTAAELRSGALQDVDSAVHVHFMDRSSTTLMVDGQLVRGAHGLAGSRPRAHMGPDGQIMDWATLRQSLYQGHELQRMSLMITAAQAGDQEYRDLLTRYAVGLAPRIGFLVRAIDPELVLLGGQMLRMPEILTEQMTSAIHQVVGHKIEVRLAQHPLERAAPLGGVYAALDAIDWVS